jgi:hypothetical protein
LAVRHQMIPCPRRRGRPSCRQAVGREEIQ